MTTKNKKITVIDYGMGNLFNVIRALESIGCDVYVSGDVKKIKNSERILLPGVGAFEDGIQDLKKNKLDTAIKEYAQTGKPLLGICLGMQLLMTSSEENRKQNGGEDLNHYGLDLIKGKVKRFKDPKDQKNNYKIPQIGWNELLKVETKQNSTLLNSWKGSILDCLEVRPHMYFLHSYFVVPSNKKVSIAETNYGEDKFCSVFQEDNIIGCQFHPERSGEQGLIILKNFLSL